MINEFNRTLPIARYRFEFDVVASIGLPEYAGSMLRGAFGRALRKISCMTKQKECKTCPLYRTCPYPAIFETPAPLTHELQQFSQVPNGYIIEPPEWGARSFSKGEKVRFELVLFGQLIQQLPLIAFSWKRAFEYQVGHGKGELIQIQYLPNNASDESVYANGNILPHLAELTLPAKLKDNMALEIVTPLRLQRDGKPLSPQTIHKERLLLGLAKRFSLLSEFHQPTPVKLDFEQLQQELHLIEDNHDLRWRDWTRYSSRQQQKMQLGGVVGEWTLSHLSQHWQQLLFLGQWLHVGKNATFGLGKYTITNL